MLVHASVWTLLPSSQSSLAAGLTLLSPQADSVQSSLQVGELPMPSHFSPTVVFMMPSPHMANVQFTLQINDSPLVSHSSVPPVTPLPQLGSVQLLSQLSPLM